MIYRQEFRHQMPLQKGYDYGHLVAFGQARHCVKSVQMRSVFCSVFSRTRHEYGPEKNSVFEHFLRSEKVTITFALSRGKFL